MNLNFDIAGPAGKIADRLQQSGYEAFFVGGCVRDMLLGKTPKDYDIATNALPFQVKEIFTDAHIIETGIKHGTVTVILDSFSVEVTTYRTDGEYLDNRHPSNVVFAGSVNDDLSRRDFTINAIAYSKNTGIVDIFNGIGDLKSKLIRCVGNPSERFIEDALRILRAMRFESVMGFEIDLKTVQAMNMNKERIKSISPERIQSEFSKIICGDFAEKTIDVHRGIISVFLPEIEAMWGFKQNNPYHVHDVFTHTLKVIANTPPVLHLRLAALLHDSGKPFTYTEDEKGTGHFYGHASKSVEITKSFCKRLRFDNESTRKVSGIVKLHDTVILPSSKAVKRFLRRNSTSVFSDVMIIKRADLMGQNPDLFEKRLKELEAVKDIFDKIISEGECFSLNELAINGSDLVEMGYSPGRYIGEILNDCLTCVIDKKLHNSFEELKKYVIITFKIK